MIGEKKLKLKLKLIFLYGTIISIGLIVLGFINFSSAESSLLRSKIQELNLIVDLKAMEIANFVGNFERHIHIAQDDYNIKTNLPIFNAHYSDPNSIAYIQSEMMLDKQILILLSELGLHNIIFLNMSGKVIYSANKQRKDVVLGDELEDPSFKVFNEGRIETNYSRIFEDISDKEQHSLLVSGPIYNDGGRLIGVIVFDVDMDPVYQLIKKTAGLGETGEILIGRNEGDYALFLHNLKYDSRAAFKRKVLYTVESAKPMREATMGKSGSGLTIDYRSEPIVASWKPVYVGEHTWGLVAKIDRKEAFAAMKDLERKFLVVLWVTVFLSIFIILINATAITDPIEKLRQGVADVAAGQLGRSIDNIYSKDEIGDLAQAFNQMISDLQKTTVSRDDLVQEIEQRKIVEDSLREQRTAALNLIDDAEEAREKAERAEKTIKKAVEELARSNQELEQFAYVASHDLQEPIRKIVGFSQLFARKFEGKMDKNSQEYMTFIVEGAKRMQSLIQDLLHFSRVGRGDSKLEVVDLNEILKEVTDNLEMTIKENNVKIHSIGLPTVAAHKVQIVQLFQNIIGNGIKYRGEADPELTISVEKRDSQWEFSIRDNGIGIDPEFKDRIFVIFQRLHTKEQYSGTGIGLAVCKKIVDRHGGKIWVENSPGGGSDFKFTLPDTG